MKAIKQMFFSLSHWLRNTVSYLNHKVYFGRCMANLPNGAVIFFPVRNTFLGCGLAGIVAVKKEKITVPAGTFDTLQIALIPSCLDKSEEVKKKKFQGLFGIKGTIRLWVDVEKKRPIRVRGIIPFGVDLNAEVDLVRKLRRVD